MRAYIKKLISVSGSDNDNRKQNNGNGSVKDILSRISSNQDEESRDQTTSKASSFGSSDLRLETTHTQPAPQISSNSSKLTEDISNINLKKDRQQTQSDANLSKNVNPNEVVSSSEEKSLSHLEKFVSIKGPVDEHFFKHLNIFDFFSLKKVSKILYKVVNESKQYKSFMINPQLELQKVHEKNLELFKIEEAEFKSKFNVFKSNFSNNEEIPLWNTEGKKTIIQRHTFLTYAIVSKDLSDDQKVAIINKSPKTLLNYASSCSITYNSRTFKFNQTPVIYAINMGSVKILEALLKNGASPNIGSSQLGYTPLVTAMFGLVIRDQNFNFVLDTDTRLSLVKLLLSYNADPNRLTKASTASPTHSYTQTGIGRNIITPHVPVVVAVSFDKDRYYNYAFKLFQLLVDYKANLNLNETPEFLNTGNTLLHYASKNGLKEIVEFLLSIKMDANAANKEGEKPFDLSENQEIKSLLTNTGSSLPYSNN